jgi:glutamate-1-semialdehyde aminotransferase
LQRFLVLYGLLEPRRVDHTGKRSRLRNAITDCGTNDPLRSCEAGGSTKARSRHRRRLRSQRADAAKAVILPPTYARFFHACSRGVFLAPSGYETTFVSLAHDDEIIDATIATAADAAREVAATVS